MQQNSEELGLTGTQGIFLHHIWYRNEKQGLTTISRDLEEFFDTRHSTVSGILQRMEASGFITLQASRTDRRCKAVVLTEKGRSAIEKTGQHIRQTEAVLTEGMTPEETAEFRRLLQIAAGNLGVCMPHSCHHKPKEDMNP